METISTNCPKCGLHIEYWTRNNYIECPKCKAIIEVEPCTEVEEIVEETNDEPQT